MSKFIVILVITALMTGLAPKAQATENDYIFSSNFYNDVIYGTLAGLIIGLAVGQGSTGTFKMTSLGMYGGIVLGLVSEGNQKGPSKPTYEQNPSSDFSPKTPSYVFTFHY